MDHNARLNVLVFAQREEASGEASTGKLFNKSPLLSPNLSYFFIYFLFF